MSSIRRPFVTPAALIAAVLLLSGCASAQSVAGQAASDVEATGETTEVTVTVEGMRYIPDVVEVPVGDELIITFENTGTDVHDLVLANGTGTDHLGPGETEVIEVGVISADMDAWCSVGNHRAMGMEMTIRAID
ncbi:cupredoxin domain-containing protein [Microbacterium esteraromaticum]|uniref:cupredoxin domain-containing protein n=1 Tax=Microbacterium esteraromaticum TaxID=57043 RepID=UPI001A8FE4E5|nr:cupredoxin domain-containing protein [Microbacterium esteraromaticum]MBN8424937.1 cupredoxin domain-containing protein [Microbacterium esteraromaticum]MCA1307131.1 cupredoxin domain-containing protein [Microbacterium esteraromaticum]